MNSEKELLIEICKKCYLDCKFCSSNADKNSLIYLDLKLIKSIIRDANRLNISKVEISGGEPFVHPNFLRICQNLSENHKRIYIYTCGNLNTDGKLHHIPYEILEELKRFRIHTLRFNLQSYRPEIHNYLTNSNSFKNTISSLKNSVDLGFNTEVHLIPLKQNYLEISQTIDYCKNLGVSQVKFLRFVPHGRGVVNKNILELDFNLYNDVLENLIRLKKEYKDFIEISSSFNNSQKFENLEICRNCHIGKSKIAITPEGKVFPCVSTKNLKLFNFQINNQSLYDILNSSNFYSKLKGYLTHQFVHKNEKRLIKKDMDVCPTQKYLKIRPLN